VKRQQPIIGLPTGGGGGEVGVVVVDFKLLIKLQFPI